MKQIKFLKLFVLCFFFSTCFFLTYANSNKSDSECGEASTKMNLNSAVSELKVISVKNGFVSSSTPSNSITFSWKNAPNTDKNVVFFRSLDNGFATTSTINNPITNGNGSWGSQTFTFNDSRPYTARGVIPFTGENFLIVVYAFSNTGALTSQQIEFNITTDVLANDNFNWGYGKWNDGGRDCRRLSSSHCFSSRCIRVRDWGYSASVVNTQGYIAITLDAKIKTNGMPTGSSFKFVNGFINVNTFTVGSNWVDNVMRDVAVTYTGSAHGSPKLQNNGDTDSQRTYMDNALIRGLKVNVTNVAKIANDTPYITDSEIKKLLLKIDKNNAEMELDVSKFSKGLYLIRFESGDQSNVKKLMID